MTISQLTTDDNNVNDASNVTISDVNDATSNDDASSTNDSGGDGSVTDDSGNDNSNVSSSQKTFTQDDVTRLMTREKQQGRNSAYHDLGIDPNDSETISLIKAIIDAQKKTQEPPVAPSSELVDAQNRAIIAEAKAEAMMSGAKSQFVDDIVTLAKSRLEADDSKDFKQVISELKTKYPVWFGSDSGNDGSNSVGSKGTGSSINSSQTRSNGNDDRGSLGKRLAASKRVKKPAKSYWND